METEKRSSSDLIQKNTDPISFFEKDEVFVLSFKKTEKLASAVYMVTNLFPENEPMKWTLRKKASDLLSFILNYKDIPESGQVDFAYSTKTRVLELVSFLEVSFRGGLVSNMNFSILKQEFSNLCDLFTGTDSTSRLTLDTVSKVFFGDVRGDSNQKYGYNKGDYSISETRLVPADFPTNQKNKNLASPQSEFRRTNRQNTILEIIKKRKELTIKDLSQVIRDCSEKTIQRELNSFISSGVLKRAGVRRWSRYSLA